MTIPLRVKKILSYFMDVRLEAASSDYNHELYVLLSQGRYQLCSANAIYSFEDLYDNYRRAFKKINIKDRDIQSVLVLGLGLGSIPGMLETKFGRTFNYTTVEIDEEVARLAHKYSLSKLQSPIETIIGDAHTFIMQNQRKFDLVCMDVFVDDIIPAKFQTTAYLKALKNSIATDGILLFNRLARTKKDLEFTKDFYHDKFLTVFEQGSYIDVRGNWMLTNKKL